MASRAVTDKQKKQYKKYLVNINNLDSNKIHPKQPPMKLIIPEYINKENSNNPDARQGIFFYNYYFQTNIFLFLEYISKFNENLKSKDSEVLCNTILNVFVYQNIIIPFFFI